MFRFPGPLILTLLCGVIFSCEDAEEPTPDTTAPIITFESPIENRKVKGTITISATAEDDSGELSMQVFLDANLVKENPAGEIFLEVDTKTLTEGIHTFKITAIDKAGNASEK